MVKFGSRAGINRDGSHEDSLFGRSNFFGQGGREFNIQRPKFSFEEALNTTFFDASPTIKFKQGFSLTKGTEFVLSKLESGKLFDLIATLYKTDSSQNFCFELAKDCDPDSIKFLTREVEGKNILSHMHAATSCLFGVKPDFKELKLYLVQGTLMVENEFVSMSSKVHG